MYIRRNPSFSPLLGHKVKQFVSCAEYCLVVVPLARYGRDIGVLLCVSIDSKCFQIICRVDSLSFVEHAINSNCIEIVCRVRPLL